MRLTLPVHGAADGEEARRAALQAGLARALAALEVDPNAPEPGVGELFAITHERTRDLPRDEARRRIATARAYLRDRTAPRFAGGVTPSVGVQVLRLGPAWLLGVPAEATVDVGLDWKARLDGAPGAVVSIANGWFRYLPHPRNFAEVGRRAPLRDRDVHLRARRRNAPARRGRRVAGTPGIAAARDYSRNLRQRDSASVQSRALGVADLGGHPDVARFGAHESRAHQQWLRRWASGAGTSG